MNRFVSMISDERHAQVMRFAFLALLAFAFVALPDLAQAQVEAPWEKGLCQFTKAITGKWIGWVAVIAIVVAAIAYGVGESNQNFQTAMRIVAGFSIALSAASLVAMFFPGVITPSECTGVTPR